MIQALNPFIAKKDTNLMKKELLKGNLLKGEYLNKIQVILEKYINVNYVVLTNSGTSALHLILKTLNLKNTDEVILPTLTFPATLFPIQYVGAKPVFVDVNIETWNMDCELVKNAITSNTKAILPVDLYGNPADNQCLAEIAADHKIHLVYDSAESLGSEYNNIKCGAFGDASVLSFAFNKMITSIEGGAILTNSKKLYEKTILMANNCKEKENDFSCYGYNYRMNNIGATLLFSQFQRLEHILKIKGYLKRFYLKNLDKKFKFQKVENKSKPNNWLISVISEDNSVEIIKKLKKKNIELRPIFKPLHQFDFISPEKKFPNAEYIYNHAFSMPSSVGLTVEEIKIVLEALNEESN